MNKVLIGILIGAVLGYGYGRLHPPAAAADAESEDFEDAGVQAVAATESRAPDSSRSETKSERAAFHCDGRIYCSQMTSCEEAKYFLAHCPGVKMDNHGHGDGIPCERQWCGSR